MVLNIKKRFAVALAALLIAAGAATAAPAVAMAEETTATEISPLLMNTTVVDTYYHYACPKGISSHNMDYNKTYRLLTFKTSYKRSGRQTISSWKAKNCNCGNGTVYYYKNIYHTW